MPVQHRLLAGGGWQKLSLMEQLGNVGSEVGRAAKWRGKDENSCRAAYQRALELMDLTMQDRRWRGRMKEISRSRELLAGVMLEDGAYQTTLQDLERYFLQFALAARLKK